MATASPLESRVGAVLMAVNSNSLDTRLDRDALKVLKLHLLKVLHAKSISAADEAILAAFDLFSVDCDIEKLVIKIESFVLDIIADTEIGTCMIGNRIPAVPAGHSSSVSHGHLPVRVTNVDGSHARLSGPFTRARAVDAYCAEEVCR